MVWGVRDKHRSIVKGALRKHPTPIHVYARLIYLVCFYYDFVIESCFWFRTTKLFIYLSIILSFLSILL